MICLEPAGLWFPARALYLGVRGICVPSFTTSMCGQRWLWRMSWCHLVLLFWNCTFSGAVHKPTTFPQHRALYIAAPGPLHWLFPLPKGLVLKKPCMQVQFVLSYNESRKKKNTSFYKDAFILVWLQTEKISYEYVKEFFEIWGKVHEDYRRYISHLSLCFAAITNNLNISVANSNKSIYAEVTYLLWVSCGSVPWSLFIAGWEN